MKHVYIAGPFRAPTPREVELNIREAERWGEEVWKRGGVAVVPHALNRNMQGLLDDHTFMKWMESLLCRCDGILLTPKWVHSEGSRAEFELARSEGLPVWWVEASSELWQGVGAGGLIEMHRWLLDLKPGQKLPGYP